MLALSCSEPLWAMYYFRDCPAPFGVVRLATDMGPRRVMAENGLWYWERAKEVRWLITRRLRVSRSVHQNSTQLVRNQQPNTSLSSQAFIRAVEMARGHRDVSVKGCPSFRCTSLKAYAWREIAAIAVLLHFMNEDLQAQHRR
jgi:hypothetical protein